MADVRVIQAVKLVDPDTAGELEFALLADDPANPTAPSMGSLLHVYDGATWDLARGTSVDGLLVNLGANNDVTIGAPGNPVRTHASSVDTAASASFSVSTTDLGGTTRALSKIEASSAAPIRVEVKSVVNDVETPITVLFGQAGGGLCNGHRRTKCIPA